MQMHRIRFSVRSVMIAVAIIAILLAGGIETIRLKRFRAECLIKANAQGQEELRYRQLAQLSREIADERRTHSSTCQRAFHSRTPAQSTR